MPSFPRWVSPVWTQLLSAPFSRFSEILPLNDNEFLVVPYKCNQSIFGDGVHTYNTKEDEWSAIIPFGKDFESTFHSAALDASKQLIFVCDCKKLYRFNLKTKSMKILADDFKIGNRPKMVLLDNAIHLIGDNDKHFVMDRDCKCLSKVHEFGIDHRQFFGNLIFLKTERKLILFNGDRTEMHQFETWNNKWSKKKIEIVENYHCKKRKSLQDSAIVCSANEEYIFCFGGCSLDFYWTDSIFVYDVKRNRLTQSPIRLPFKSFCRAQMIKNERRDYLMVTGFINECFQTAEYQNVQLLPFYLIQFIARWISNEYIHLMDYFDGEHWKIHIDSFFAVRYGI